MHARTRGQGALRVTTPTRSVPARRSGAVLPCPGFTPSRVHAPRPWFAAPHPGGGQAAGVTHTPLSRCRRCCGARRPVVPASRRSGAFFPAPPRCGHGSWDQACQHASRSARLEARCGFGRAGNPNCPRPPRPPTRCAALVKPPALRLHRLPAHRAVAPARHAWRRLLGGGGYSERVGGWVGTATHTRLWLPSGDE